MDLPVEQSFYNVGFEILVPKELKQDKLDRIVSILEGAKSLTCYYCGFPLESDTKTCLDCQYEQIDCSVCKLSVTFGEEIGSCSLCEAKGHLVHLQEWIKTQGKCPVCLQSLPLEGIVLEEVNRTKKE